MTLGTRVHEPLHTVGVPARGFGDPLPRRGRLGGNLLGDGCDRHRQLSAPSTEAIAVAGFGLEPSGDRRAPTTALAPFEPVRLAPDLVKVAGLESLAEPGHVRRGRFDGVTEDRGRQGGVAAGQLVETAGSADRVGNGTWGKPLAELGGEQRDRGRLRREVVHAGGAAPLRLAVHHVGRECHDRRPRPAPARPRGAASPPPCP